MYFNKNRTERGFKIIEFEDCYNQKCSLQQSSNLKKQIWLGADIVSYDEKDEPYNSRMCLDRKGSLKVAFRLLIFSITGRVFFSKNKSPETKKYFNNIL